MSWWQTDEEKRLDTRTYVSFMTAPALSSMSLPLISRLISSFAWPMNLASSFLFALRPRIRSWRVRSHIEVDGRDSNDDRVGLTVRDKQRSRTKSRFVLEFTLYGSYYICMCRYLTRDNDRQHFDRVVLSLGDSN